MKQTAKRNTRAQSSTTSANHDWRKNIQRRMIIFDLRFAQVVALSAFNLALFPSNSPILQATGVPGSEFIGCWEQVIGINNIKELKCAFQSI